jgi:hypothetical protein
MTWEAIYLKQVALINNPPDEFDIADALRARGRMQGKVVEAEAVNEADRRLVRVALYTEGDPHIPASGEQWFENIKAIARGEYPLDQLPGHVRDLAEKLYYD